MLVFVPVAALAVAMPAPLLFAALLVERLAVELSVQVTVLAVTVVLVVLALLLLVSAVLSPLALCRLCCFSWRCWRGWWR